MLDEKGTVAWKPPSVTVVAARAVPVVNRYSCVTVPSPLFVAEPTFTKVEPVRAAFTLTLLMARSLGLYCTNMSTLVTLLPLLSTIGMRLLLLLGMLMLAGLL